VYKIGQEAGLSASACLLKLELILSLVWHRTGRRRKEAGEGETGRLRDTGTIKIFITACPDVGDNIDKDAIADSVHEYKSSSSLYPYVPANPVRYGYHTHPLVDG
jgi:hypothetical protein